MPWRFGRFQLDHESACLWEGEQRLTLRPKTFDLLVYLVEHAGELVRKETLLEAVWPDTVVADGVLTTSMGELRKVLGETAKQPQFIATVHRRGYRFIAPVTRLDTAGDIGHTGRAARGRGPPSSPRPARLQRTGCGCRGPRDRTRPAASVVSGRLPWATPGDLCHG